ncbi:MAG: pyridoxamine 5'-phosphate oxidase family protein [Candidatus Micrarchaeota archaeon]|nr:pyridoxamine 5'-phosphate oxidase family protein [Candidatus Micrarchaeota archaeon]
MDKETAGRIARSLIEGNKYMVLSTCDSSAKPWAATVFYAHDRDYNFYFISAIDTLHAKNIIENPNVAFVIFDSHTPIGRYDAVQASGVVEQLNRQDVPAAIDTYCRKLFSGTENPGARYDPMNYTEPAEFRIFRIRLEHIYTTSEERRTEISPKDMG